MSTFLPLDSNNHPIPAVRLKDSGAHSISTSGTSARNSTAFDADTKLVTLYATSDVYIRFGGASVSATSGDHFFPAGVYHTFSVGGGRDTAHTTHIAALQVSTAGTLYISENV